MIWWLTALLFNAALALPELQTWHMWRLVPYSSLQFFVFFISLFILVGTLKPLCRSKAAWTALVQLLNALFLIFIFPQPVPLIAAGFLFYAILKSPGRGRWIYIHGALLLLPLILKQNTKEIQFWGLSYATFRAYHLLLDGRARTQLTFRTFFTFVFYFPSVLSGPIDRLDRFQAAVSESWNKRTVEFWPQAFFYLSLGLVQKFILAEALNRFALPAQLSSLKDWIQTFYVYPAYIYLDFAGYSAMAIGFSLLIGITLPENFDRPYLAKNPKEFWQRFHITLGNWLNDHFFKPLYRLLSRLEWGSPLFRQNLALFLTFLLMGLWNGPKVNFLLSGALFGVYAMVHNTTQFYSKTRGRPILAMPTWLARVLMFHFAALALLIFSGIPFR